MSLRNYVAWVTGILPVWQERGFDPATGLFRERLHLDGSPDLGADIRVRTHMRQAYTFAHAAILGLVPRDGALALAGTAMASIRARAFAPDGKPGWVHRLSSDGAVVDARRDLYDHAFALHALAWMAEATGDAIYRSWSDETIAAIDTLMAAPAGGWAESDRHELPRRQNPHMHLLEACLALYETSREPRHLARAAEIVALFRTRFFDEEIGTLRDFFGPLWEIDPAHRSDRLDPGHMMEWVWLLRRYERASGQPVGRHAALLFAAAERIGITRGGFLFDEVDPVGRPVSDGCRLWPQTEYLKACLAAFEASGDRDFLAKADAMAARILEVYVGDSAHGLWIDRFDLAGEIAVDHVPASILYHLLAPVVEYLRLAPRLAQPSIADRIATSAA